ncbi:MAG: hypothetical protein KAV87_51785 [Desulfobacteraceae bacterium]|nr:hypothetical protein [Desulfobacteraceae bacterium]
MKLRPVAIMSQDVLVIGAGGLGYEPPSRRARKVPEFSIMRVSRVTIDIHAGETKVPFLRLFG